MNKNHILTCLCLIAATMSALTASAFSASKYATTSKLASGKWVKISIPEDGVYQLTYSELKQMGFSNPQDVRIYGYGGHPISELLDGSVPDDLTQIPTKRFDDKICFYACGPTMFSIESPTSNPRFTRQQNSYSQAGYYFVTSQAGTSPKEVSTRNGGTSGQIIRTSSLDYWHHEQELMSPSQSGKEMLGELMPGNSITMNYNLPGLCPDSVMLITASVAAKTSVNSTIGGKLNGNNLNFSIGNNRIYASTSIYVFYNIASPTAIYSQTSPIPTSGNLTIEVSDTSTWTRLNYCTLSYYHNNSMSHATDNQLRMGLSNLNNSNIIKVDDATSSTLLWNISNPNDPVNCPLISFNDFIGFNPTFKADWTQMVAFDPTKRLKSIAGFEPVDNQNIHGLANPDMVIVTCEKLIPEAERVAQMHRDNDNMTVHVIDQQKIFNEFSSGTPDAMAIRLMCKMFYDRNKNKFKHLLMFGSGSFDNRQILSTNECNILTYESNNSSDENNSYVSDDFFGMLDDNSGANVTADLLTIGVGRIPCASLQEAQGDVDKLINYVNNPDYGPWRNNMMLVADYYEDDHSMHAYQAEGIGSIINEELNIGLIRNKVFVTQFPLDPATEFALEGRRSLNTQLKSGQFFMTYVGHANPTTLTKEVQLWTTTESKNATYPHLPIVTTACCDVARYDGSERGLMEIMFHKPDGGAIAMVATTRAAYANGNDALNQAFVRALFNYNSTGRMPTLGEAYKSCKNSFGQISNYNKMMFSLLGDPAMKVNYPKPYFKVTKVNGRTAGTSPISSGALQRVTVEAKVYTPDGSQVDNSFNGDATLAIYDMLKKEQTYNGRNIYFPRNLLTQVDGRVVNGVFTGVAVIPRFIQSSGSDGLISVYAHRDASNEMVSGSFDLLRLNYYNENSSLTVHDSNPPTIDAIYFDNEEAFDMCSQVGTSATLHIRATDDVSFNNQTLAVGNSMDLKIDGGKHNFPDIKAFSTMSNNGKQLDVALPMTLEPGDHTLQYTVYDAACNMTSRAINFSVGEKQLMLTVEQEPAVDVATFNISTSSEFHPMVSIKVLDLTGNLKWQTATSNFPLNWDLVGTNGRKLAPGIYTFYGKYNDGTTYGGSATGTLVVAGEHNSDK